MIMDKKLSGTNRLLRLQSVLEIIPISKSTWWAGIKTGRFPKPIKLGSRVAVWRAQDILALVQRGADES